MMENYFNEEVAVPVAPSLSGNIKKEKPFKLEFGKV